MQGRQTDARIAVRRVAYPAVRGAPEPPWASLIIVAIMIIAEEK